MPSLVRDGHYEQPSIGIKLDERLNERLEEATGVEGAFVLRVVEGSSAEEAGLRAARISREGEFIGGDIIVSVNGKKIESAARLLATLDDYRIGNTVQLGVKRGTKLIQIAVRLQAGRQP